MDLSNIKSLTLNNIKYSYPNSNILSLDIKNLEIPLNSKIAIAGRSGSGKTTLINLLTGLIPLKEGNFYLDNKMFSENNFSCLQNHISLVPQNIFLFDDTILNNILIDHQNNKINLEKIKKILEICDLSEFIQSLPNGLDTKVGEKGVFLSGGQKQKIGIARSLFDNKNIIIFDEATNSMDYISENTVLNNIIENYKDKTIILISHNYSIFKNFDYVIFLKKENPFK